MGGRHFFRAGRMMGFRGLPKTHGANPGTPNRVQAGARARGGTIKHMEPPNRIVLVPDVLAGKPIVRGTRLSVEFVVGLFGQGWSEQQVLENYPNLTHDDVVACLHYAAEVLKAERVFPLAV